MAAALGFAADNSWSLEITYVRIFIAKYMGAQKLQLIHIHIFSISSGH